VRDILKIKDLSDVIDIAQDNKYDEYVFYNPVTQEIELVFTYDMLDEDLALEEKDGMIEVIVSPYSRDMFHAFFETIEHPTVRAMFFEKFHGAKKYRKVKDLFPRYHLLERFYAFKDHYEKRIAKEWCEEHKVSYIDEDGREVVF
jgi:hypothetical protein